jgi:hypothetical protein
VCRIARFPPKEKERVQFLHRALEVTMSIPDWRKPTVTLTEEEAMQLALQVEGLVNEYLEKKGERQGTPWSGMTDSVPGIRAVVNAIHKNYL